MGWVVNAIPRPHNPRGRPSTHFTGVWVPRACLDGCGKSCPHRDSTPDIYVYIYIYFILQLLRIQRSPVSCYFLPLMAKYFPQHPVYGPPQAVLLPELRPSRIL